MEVRLGTDLHELVSLRPDRTMTTWDPTFFPGGDQFWLHGFAAGDSDAIDHNQTLYVIAARAFFIRDLKADLISGRVFHVDGYLGTCEAHISNIGIKGHVIHTGNLWVAPAFRGRGYGALATKLCHLFALHRWPEAEWVFGLQEKELAYRGFWQDQKYPHCEGQVIWDHNPYARRFDMKVVYGSRQEILKSLG